MDPLQATGTNRKEQAPHKAVEILRAALPVFAKKGFYDATMEDIAQKAAVAKGTLYLYFASKEELFSRMVVFISEQVVKGIRERIRDVDDTWKKLEIAMGTHFAVLMKYKHNIASEMSVTRASIDHEAILKSKLEHLKIYEDILRAHYEKLGVRPPYSLRTGAAIILGGLMSYFYKKHFLRDLAPDPQEFIQTYKYFVKTMLEAEAKRLASRARTSSSPKRLRRKR